jgi:hypothetical protein
LNLLEGAEKFLKVNEMIGRYLLDMKEFSSSTDCQIMRIDNELSQRVTKVEFQAVSKTKSKKLKNKLRD